MHCIKFDLMFNTSVVNTLVLFIVNILITSQAIRTPQKGSAPLRIIGGSDAEDSGNASALFPKYPYVVRIEIFVREINKAKTAIQYTDKFAHICTGSALTPSWSLSAAHCFFNLEKGQLIIRYGSKTPQNKNVKFAKIRSYITHTSYRSFDKDDYNVLLSNDIALAKTDPVILPYYGKVSSIDVMSLVGQEAQALGFGLMKATVEGQKVITTTLMLNKPLQTLKVMITRCSDDDIGPLAFRNYPYICVARKCNQGTNTAGGDSGGPLLHQSGIVGVLSLGPASDYETLEVITLSIGMYTPTSLYLDWIADIINLPKNNI